MVVTTEPTDLKDGTMNKEPFAPLTTEPAYLKGSPAEPVAPEFTEPTDLKDEPETEGPFAPVTT